MKELTKWQVVSFISRGVAMALGIIQSFVLIRLLTKSDYGVVQLGVSIGAAFGIYQHLGLASGSTREISTAKNSSDIFKLFMTAAVIKYVITIPLSIGLFLFANKLALETYKDASLILPIKLYAAVLMIQGLQSLFNSVISGMKRFKVIFIYQAVIAVVSLTIFIPLVALYKINGYFYALIVFNLIASTVLGAIALGPLRGSLKMPSRRDYAKLLKELLSISLAIYAVKILYTFWERSGPLLLGVAVTKEMVATFALAMLYSKKLLTISDAVTDVNLPVFSDTYAKHFEEFKTLFTENFNKLFAIIMFSGIFVVFWSQNLIPFLVGGKQYNDALVLILPLTFAFMLYSFINIVHSSIFVPAKMVKEMIFAFALLLLTATFVYFGARTRFDFLSSMAYGMFISSIVCLIAMELMIKRKLHFGFINHDHVLILSQSFFICLASGVNSLLLKVILYGVFCLLFLWGIFIAKFVTRADLDYSIARVRTLLGKVLVRT